MKRKIDEGKVKE